MKPIKHLQKLQPSYIREILSEATAEGVISLAGGLPAEHSFPMPLLQEGFAELGLQRGLFQYGETAGYQPLLEELRQHYPMDSQHQAIICNGSQQGLDLVARTFIAPGNGVVVEAPSYLGALQVFYIGQAKLLSVPQERDGPNLMALEQVFREQKPKLFYAVPDFHNPTGCCWSLSIRKAVAALCIRYGVMLLEDAPYRDLRFSGDALPMVSSFCPEHALVLRSFSKTVTPGIRLGVLSGPEQWIEPIMKVKQAADLHTNVPMQFLLLKLLQHQDFNAHLQNTCQRYHEQYEFMSDELNQKLGTNLKFNSVQGGMFLWGTIESECKCQGETDIILAKNALKNGVAVVPGGVFYPEGFNTKPALRLNFSHGSKEQISEGISRLKDVMAEL